MGPIGADLIENTNATGEPSQGVYSNLSYSKILTDFDSLKFGHFSGGDIQSKDETGPKSPVTEQPHRNSAPRI